VYLPTLCQTLLKILQRAQNRWIIHYRGQKFHVCLPLNPLHDRIDHNQGLSDFCRSGQIRTSCTSHVDFFGCLSDRDIIRSGKETAQQIPGTKITRNLSRHHSHISMTDGAKLAPGCPKYLNTNSIQFVQRTIHQTKEDILFCNFMEITLIWVGLELRTNIRGLVIFVINRF